MAREKKIMGQDLIGPTNCKQKKKKRLQCWLVRGPEGLCGVDAGQLFWSPFIMRASPVRPIKNWSTVDRVKRAGLARLPTTNGGNALG